MLSLSDTLAPLSVDVNDMKSAASCAYDNLLLLCDKKSIAGAILGPFPPLPSPFP